MSKTTTTSPSPRLHANATSFPNGQSFSSLLSKILLTWWQMGTCPECVTPQKEIVWHADAIGQCPTQLGKSQC
jgi:hypothetical protein